MNETIYAWTERDVAQYPGFVNLSVGPNGKVRVIVRSSLAPADQGILELSDDQLVGMAQAIEFYLQRKLAR